MASKRKKTEEAQRKTQAMQANGGQVAEQGLNKKEADAGINLQSPYLRGCPIGRDKDPRSLGSGITEQPTIPMDTHHNFAYHNPLETIQDLMVGFSSPSTRLVTTMSEVTLEQPFVLVRQFKWFNRRFIKPTGEDRASVRTPIVTSNWVTQSNTFTSDDLHLNTAGSIEISPSSLTSGVFNSSSTAKHPSVIGKIITNDTRFTAKIANNTFREVFLVLNDGKVIRGVVGSYQFPYSVRIKRGFWWWKKFTTVTRYSTAIGIDFKTLSFVFDPTNLGQTVNPSFIALLATPANNYRIAFSACFFGLPALGLDPTRGILDGWENHPEIDPFKGLIIKSFLSSQWKNTSEKRLINIDPLILQRNTIDQLQQYLDLLVVFFEIQKALTPVVVDSLFNGLEYNTRSEPEVIALFSRLGTALQSSEILLLAEEAQETISDFYSIKNQYEEVSKLEEVSVGLLNSLLMVQTTIARVCANPAIISLTEDYLEVLYLYRLIFIKKRFNKIDGTFLNVLHIEGGILNAAMNLGKKTSPLDPLIGTPMQIVKAIGHLTLVDKANFRRQGLPIPLDVVVRVYVPVEYHDGELVLPKTGFYKAVSNQTLENLDLDITVFLNFSDESLRPIIRKNNLEIVDPFKLVQLMPREDLSLLEKFCAAAEYQDWWEINIPVDAHLKTLVSKGVFDPSEEPFLIYAPTNLEVSSLLGVLGGEELSPIRSNTSPPHINSNMIN